MAGAPSPARQRSMLARLRAGMVLAAGDHAVLRYLELRRHARALPLHHARSGKLLLNRAWQITDAGVAAALRLDAPRARRRARAAAHQIDIEEAIASASSGGAPEGASLTDLDAPAPSLAGVSAPEGRSSKPALTAAKPETLSP